MSADNASLGNEAEALAQDEEAALRAVRRMYEATCEDLFVAYCVREVAIMLQGYHEKRARLLRSTAGLKSCEALTLREWLSRPEVSAHIMNEWKMHHQRSLFHLPAHRAEACKAIDETWRPKFPHLLERLQKQLDQEGLPDIEMVQGGDGDAYEFVIRFVGTE